MNPKYGVNTKNYLSEFRSIQVLSDNLAPGQSHASRINGILLFHIIYIYTHTHTHTHIYIYIYTHTHTYIYIYTYIHTHIHTHTHIYIYIYRGADKSLT